MKGDNSLTAVPVRLSAAPSLQGVTDDLRSACGVISPWRRRNSLRFSTGSKRSALHTSRGWCMLKIMAAKCDWYAGMWSIRENGRKEAVWWHQTVRDSSGNFCSLAPGGKRRATGPFLPAGRSRAIRYLFFSPERKPRVYALYTCTCSSSFILL